MVTVNRMRPLGRNGGDRMAELSKFDELRMKTEKQLIELVNSELDLGIREARQALGSADTWPVADDHYLSFPLLTASDVGQNIWKRAKEIKGFKVTEFRLVQTELPETQHRPPDAPTYS